MRQSTVRCSILITAALMTASVSLCRAADNTAQDVQREAAAQQAREDYRLYLQQMKELARQYKEVSGEIRKIVQEEGLPTFEDVEPVKESAVTASDTRIEQTDKEILVHVDLPGVQKDTIKAIVQSGTLVHISAVRKGGKEIEKWVTLPVLVQESGFRGEYVDGVLSLTLIKAGQGDKEVQIPIR